MSGVLVNLLWLEDGILKIFKDILEISKKHCTKFNLFFFLNQFELII